jgi:hypothetical protein
MNKTGNEGGSVTIPLPDQDGFAGMAWWNNLTERERAYWAFLAKTGKGVRRLGTVQGLFYAAVVEGMVIDPATQPFAELYCVGPRLAFQCVP